MELKEQIRVSLQSILGLLKTLGPSLQFPPQVNAALILATHLVELHWDEIWAIVEKDTPPELYKAMGVS